MRLDRRRFLSGLGGGVVALASGATPSFAQSETLSKRDAEYVARHAELRSMAYTEFANRWQVKEGEELERYFEVTPEDIAFSLVPTVAGDAVDLANNLQWYSEVQHISVVTQVHNQGIRSFGSQPRGIGGSAAASAAEKNADLAQLAERVADAAYNYAENPGPTARSEVETAIEAEQERLRADDDVRQWDDVAPGQYSIAGSEEVLEWYVEHIRMNVEFVEHAETVLTTHRRVVRTDERPFLTLAIDHYDDNVETVREEVPGVLFDRFAGERVNVFLTETAGTTDRDTVTETFFVETGSDGRIVEFDLVTVEDVDLFVYLPQEVAEKAATSGDPMAVLLDAYEDDEIVYEAQGLDNKVKYGVVENGSGIIDRGANAIDDIATKIDDVVESVSDFFDGLL